MGRLSNGWCLVTLWSTILAALSDGQYDSPFVMSTCTVYINCDPVPRKMPFSTLLGNKGVLLDFSYSQNVGISLHSNMMQFQRHIFPTKEIDKSAFQVCPRCVIFTLVLNCQRQIKQF